jgi:DNA-binding transcriptional ArsR family regulator
LPASELERVSHAYSPLLEAVLSLHVLVEPKHHPLQHPWVREMRALPPALKRSVADFAFVYRHLIPDLFAPSADAGLRTFEEDLAAFLELDAETIALDFSRPMWDHTGKRDTAHLKTAKVQGHIARAAKRLGGDPERASLIYADPAEFAKRFADFVASYWAAAFAQEWERMEPLLARTIGETGLRIAAAGFYDFVRTLSLKLRVDEEREEFGIDLPHYHRVEVTLARPLLLIPSVYVWPHVHVNCDEPWPLSLIYPAPFLAEAARTPLPSDELVQLLRALSDQTRLRALKLIAERPRSTQELAPLVGISEAGLSKHLRQLADVGLLASKREGYYVLYSFVPDRIEPLSDSLRRFLTE